jgi:hypothetical protein
VEAQVAAAGITPLDYMIGIVRGETEAGFDPAIAVARESLRFEGA